MPETPPTLPQRILEPLTRRNLNGDVYKRESVVESQIISSIGLPDEGVIARAKISDKEVVGFLQEETLVYLIRESAQNQRQLVADILLEILLVRCQRQVDYRIRSLDSDLANEAYAEIMRKLFEKIFGAEGQSDYLQVRFWNALDRIAIDVFRQCNHRREQDEANLMSSPYTAGEETEEVKDEWEQILIGSEHLIPGESRWSSVERKALIEDALQVLGEPTRTAFLLHYLEGWQIESKDPDEMTLSKYYQVTPKTIGNWLRKAKSDLKIWRGDHNE